MKTQWEEPSLEYDLNAGSAGIGVDPNALHTAVSDAYTSTERVRKLVAEGYSPNAVNNDGDS